MEKWEKINWSSVAKEVLKVTGEVYVPDHLKNVYKGAITSAPCTKALSKVNVEDHLKIVWSVIAKMINKENGTHYGGGQCKQVYDGTSKSEKLLNSIENILRGSRYENGRYKNKSMGNGNKPQENEES